MKVIAPILSEVATGTAPVTVQSTTECTSLHAATATALHTARTINGVSFNGTANITIPASGTGASYALANSYISGTGTAGVDNTAQTVKTIVLPGDTLTQLGDRLRVVIFWRDTAGTNVTATTKLGPTGTEVTIASDVGLIDDAYYENEIWVSYIDSTHANVIERGSGSGTSAGGASGANVAGFTWGSDQNILVAQNAVSGNHVLVLQIMVDIFPKGT